MESADFTCCLCFESLEKMNSECAQLCWALSSYFLIDFDVDTDEIKAEKKDFEQSVIKYLRSIHHYFDCAVGHDLNGEIITERHYMHGYCRFKYIFRTAMDREITVGNFSKVYPVEICPVCGCIGLIPCIESLEKVGPYIPEYGLLKERIHSNV
jgi:hypothetical protein